MAIEQLIAMGGTQIKSPVQRYLETKSQMAQEERNRLADAATRQSMGIQQQQNVRAQQAHQAQQFESFGKTVTPLLEQVEALPEADRPAAFAQLFPQIKQIAQQMGIDTSDMTPDYDPAENAALISRFGTPKKEMFEPVRDAGGRIVAQKSTTTGKVIADPRAPKDPDTIINNNLGDQNELAKSLSKELGKDIVSRRKDATDAKHSLESSNTAIDLLNSGVITGTGANFIKETGKALQRVGINFAEDVVANTEAFYANQAKQVAQIIKAFGAGTGLSDADREYAEKAAAGKITMSEESLRKIIDINQRASLNVINEFNSDIDKIPRTSLPFDLKIDVPEIKSATTKISKEDQVLQEADEILGID